MIVVAGDNLVDLIVSPDGRLEPVPGGGAFNTARTLARLGRPVAFLCCLSTDHFGRRLRAALADDGVDLGLVAATDAPTTLAVAELDHHGSATYRFYLAGTAAASLDDAHVRSVMATDPDVLHVASLGLVMEPIGATIEALVGRIGPATLLMVDPNCRPTVIADAAGYRRRLGAILARADVIKVSDDDLAYLEPGLDARTAAERLREGSQAVVLVTRGADPVLVVGTAGRAFEVEVPAITVVDTVGCGDAFGGGFLAWWSEHGLGRDALADPATVRDAVAFAVEVAAITGQRAGADPPRRSELLART
jgi:fructokinase